MKYTLLIPLIICSMLSCMPQYHHKKFTYTADSAPHDIDKHLKINGTYVRDTFIKYTAKQPHNTVKEVFIYGDGSIGLSLKQHADTKKPEQYFTKKNGIVQGVNWGQCRIVGDTLFAQTLTPTNKHHHKYGIYIDTFLVRSDTELELTSNRSDGKNTSIFHFRPSAAKPDSSRAPIRKHKWYWAK